MCSVGVSGPYCRRSAVLHATTAVRAWHNNRSFCSCVSGVPRLGNGRWLPSHGLAYESVICRLLAGLVWPQAGQPRQPGFAPLVLYPPAGQSTCVLIARAELHAQPGAVTQALSSLHGFMRANFPLAEISHMTIPTVRVRGTAKLYGQG